MTLEGTNTYVYGADPCVVIDTGSEDEGHLEAIRGAAAERGGIGLVLLTHSHGDHAAGADRLGAEVVLPEGGETHAGLRVLATPGHAADHVCFLSDDGVCFSGDLVLGLGSTIVPPGGGSLAAYMDSLRLLQAEEIELIAPGHGPWVTDPAAKLAEYVEHREMREAACWPPWSAASVPARPCWPRPGTTSRSSCCRWRRWRWRPTSKSSRPRAGCRTTSASSGHESAFRRL